MQLHVPKVRLASVFFVLFPPRPGLSLTFSKGPVCTPSPIMALRRPPLVCLESRPIIANSPFQNQTHPLLGTLTPSKFHFQSARNFLYVYRGGAHLVCISSIAFPQITLLICAKRGLSSRWRVESLLGPMPHWASRLHNGGLKRILPWHLFAGEPISHNWWMYVSPIGYNVIIISLFYSHRRPLLRSPICR